GPRRPPAPGRGEPLWAQRAARRLAVTDRSVGSISWVASPRTRKRVDRRTRGARAEGSDARATLVAAAAKVFARRGYAGSSMDQIAKEAGFSKGALYWHFDSKEDLF